MHEFLKYSLIKGTLMLASTWMILSGAVWAEEAESPQSSDSQPFSGFNIRGKTFGGQQFWADELVYGEWRIQRNVFTSHCRLLDDRDIRLAWGEWEACVAKLEAEKEARDLPPNSGKVVVLVHGLGRSRKFMRPIADYLRENSDYSIVNIDYPSTRAGIDSHARGLASVIEHLGDDVTEINFVAHSLGSLVVRHYLADVTADDKKLDPRIKRFVMLGPPNQGAALARLFKDVPLYNVALRGTGKQLAIDFDALAEHMGRPPCQFGIIAGGKGDAEGYNPFIAGDDDRIIRVAETRLPGARDYRFVPLRHTSLAREKEPLAMTLQFLRAGHFTTEKERQPIEEK